MGSNSNFNLVTERPTRREPHHQLAEKYGTYSPAPNYFYFGVSQSIHQNSDDIPLKS